MFAILTKAEMKKLVNTIHTLTVENKQLKAETKTLKKECDRLYNRYADLCLECFKLRHPEVFDGRTDTVSGNVVYAVMRNDGDHSCVRF